LKNGKISAQKLNFIIAVCAILISSASFYATYLQADAANKQVKAMTLPLLQFSTGNWNSDLKKKQLTFTLKNAGLGAAIIKNINFIYKNKKYYSLTKYLHACCEQGISLLSEHKREIENEESLITSKLVDTILAGQQSNEFLMLNSTQLTKPLWLSLNDERWKTKLEVCYCSLLDDCYITKENGVTKSIEECL